MNDGPVTQNEDGSWSPVIPLGWQGSGIDFEVYDKEKPKRWEAYDEDVLVGIGTARTRFGLAIGINRARKRLTS